MQVGLFMAPQWPPETDLGESIGELREQVRVARANGFRSLLIGQHLVTGPLQMLQPMPLLAHLAREAEGMQIGPGVALLSMLNPVLVAEEGASIDWMCGGNFVLAAGLGYRPEEFIVTGSPIGERVSRLCEALEIVKRLWTEETVTHEGKHFRIPGVGSSIRPKQRPRPPIWLGGDVEPAVRRAARLADAWLAAPTNTLPRLQALLELFAQERSRLGLAPAACPIVRECFVGRDARHAEEVSRGPLRYKYESYAAWGQTDTSGSGLEDNFDAFCKDRFIVGDAAFVRDEIARYRGVLGTEHMLLRVQWPGLPQAEALGNIERIGRLMTGGAA